MSEVWKVRSLECVIRQSAKETRLVINGDNIAALAMNIERAQIRLRHGHAKSQWVDKRPRLLIVTLQNRDCGPY